MPRVLLALALAGTAALSPTAQASPERCQGSSDEALQNAALLLQQQRFDDAEALLDHTEATVQSEAWRNFLLGKVADSRHDWAQAVQHYQDVLTTFPEVETSYHDATPRISLSWSLAEEGNADQALQQAVLATQVDPHNIWATSALGTAYYLQERFDLARVQFEHVLSVAPDAVAQAMELSNIAELDILAGRMDQAESKLIRAYQLVSDHWFIANELAFLYDVTGREEASQTMAKRAAELLAQNGEQQLYSVFVWPELRLVHDALMAEGRQQSAEALQLWTLLDAIEKRGELHVAWLRGRAAAHLGRTPLATVTPVAPALTASSAVIRPVHSTTPTLPAAEYLAQGATSMQQGRLSAAINSFARAVELEPANVQALLMLGHARYLHEDFYGAHQALEDAAALEAEDRTRALVFHALAQLDMAEGRLGLAEAHLNRALELAPSHPAAYEGLALLYDATSRAEAAATMESYGVQNDPYGQWQQSELSVWPELQHASNALTAEANGDKARELGEWNEVARLESSGQLKATWLAGRAAAHIAQLEASPK